MAKPSFLIKRKLSSVNDIDNLIAELQELKKSFNSDLVLSNEERFVLNKIKDGVTQKDLLNLNLKNLPAILDKLTPFYLKIGDKSGVRYILK